MPLLTTLDLGPSPNPPHRQLGRPRNVNWNMVGAVVAALALLGGFLAGLFGDYRNIGDRVTTLETQRVEDVRKAREQRDEDNHWRERIEGKLDRILERRP